MSQYSLSEAQAKAILDMKLSKLAKLEKDEIKQEQEDLKVEIKKLNDILNDSVPELNRIFTKVRDTYGDARRSTITQVAIVPEEKEIEFVEPEKCVVVMTEGGLIKRIPATSFRTQRRNGKGVRTQDDITSAVIRTNTIDQLMIFTDQGRMYRLLVNDIPVGTNVSQGQSIKSLIAMETEENPTIIYSIYRDTDAQFVLFVTKNGVIKKTTLEEYVKTKKKTGIAAINLREGDSLASVNLIKDEDVVLVSANGMVIRFNSSEVGISGRATMGVKAMALNPGDTIVSCMVVRHDTDQVAIFSNNGLGKKFELSELPRQKRAGKGLICYKPTEVSGNVSAAALVSDEDMILVVGDKTGLCVNASEIPLLGRPSIGNQIIKNNHILSVSKV